MKLERHVSSTAYIIVPFPKFNPESSSTRYVRVMNQLFTFFPAQIPLDHPDTVKSCALPYFLAFPTETFIAGMMQITQSSKYDFDCRIILGVQLVSISTH